MNRQSMTVFVAMAFALLSSLAWAEKPSSEKSNAIVDDFVQRLGEPNERRSGHGTALDYKLRDGQTLTISVADNGAVWAGLKTDLAANIGKSVEIRGEYLGPGKEADYVYTRDFQTVYLDLVARGGVYPQDLKIGDTVVVVGILRFREARKSERADVASASSMYHIDDAVVSKDSSHHNETRTKP